MLLNWHDSTKLQIKAFQHLNDKMVINTDELHPVPVKSTWHQVAIDFIGPLLISSSGNRFVFHVQGQICSKHTAIKIIFLSMLKLVK